MVITAAGKLTQAGKLYPAWIAPRQITATKMHSDSSNRRFNFNNKSDEESFKPVGSYIHFQVMLGKSISYQTSVKKGWPFRFPYPKVTAVSEITP